MKMHGLALALGSFVLAGCSAGSGLSTGSIFGGGTPAAKTAEVSPPVSDPTSRAFQVGTVSARAKKCGYNFDPQKLRAAFLASEIGAGASSTDVPRIEQIYDVSYNGVLKATAEDPKYCNEERTRDIKVDLNRHLAGDYTPTPPKKVVADTSGLFSGWGDTSSSDKGMEIHHPMDNSRD